MLATTTLSPMVLLYSRPNMLDKRLQLNAKNMQEWAAFKKTLRVPQ